MAVGLITVALAGCHRGADERIRWAYSLGRNPTESNKARIEALLDDPDRDVRTTSIVVMDRVDPPRAKRMAARAMQDQDGLVRAAAVQVCEEGADDATIRDLAARATSDPAWQVRSRALTAIAGSDDPLVYEAYSHGLSDDVWRVRRAALSAGISRPELLPIDQVIGLILTDPEWENRVEAVRALGASRDRAAYTGLDLAAADPNEFVRAAAAGERRTLSAAGVVR